MREREEREARERKTEGRGRRNNSQRNKKYTALVNGNVLGLRAVPAVITSAIP